MRLLIFVLFISMSFCAVGQTSVFHAETDSAAVFKQLDMQYGSALDTVVVVRFQLNEEGKATNGEVVRIYCKDCAQEILVKSKQKAIDELKTIDGLPQKGTSKGKDDFYLLPIVIDKKVYVKQKEE